MHASRLPETACRHGGCQHDAAAVLAEHRSGGAERHAGAAELERVPRPLQQRFRGVADPDDRQACAAVGDRLLERIGQSTEDQDSVHLTAVDQPSGVGLGRQEQATRGVGGGNSTGGSITPGADGRGAGDINATGRQSGEIGRASCRERV